MIKEPIQNMPQLKFLQKYLIRNGDDGVMGFIAGGCFKSYFMGNKIKDIDIFFPNRDYYEYAVSANEEEIINENDNCLTITNDGVKIDLICSIFGTPEEVLSNFDFTVSKFAMDDQNVYYHNRFFKDITLKKLVIDDKIPKPYSTFTRSMRYSRYGFNLCKESTIKLLDAIRREETEASVDNVAQTLYGGWD
ncbi:hypothetical protein AGMMS50268_03850 [Spirochaetia bacterium]|nr:hypothetical protein AGMMS50268_03850 [Spirochaetia bacterium]